MQNKIGELGYPGMYPFTRGVYPTMYAGRLWTMRQYSGYATAAETNRRYKYLIGRGQTGLSVAFDLPTQMGYSSTNAVSDGEVGKAGVAIDTIADMEELFDGIPLDRVSVSMTINASASVILAMYLAAAQGRGIAPDLLSGTVQNDVLKEFIARGCYIFPPEPSLKIAVDVMEYCAENVPKWNSISISGYHIREAGSTAAQEIGFALANGICYVDAARRRGLSPDAIGNRISFFFNAHNDFIEEIAKFRAARRLWARIMAERFGVKERAAQTLRFHVQTAGCTLTAQQIENNITRVSLQALAAILGGAQSLHTNAMDEAIALPTEETATIALRTQQILAYETGISDVIDPLGGASLIEETTDRLESEASEMILKIDQLGGAVAAIVSGYYQREIERSALAYQRAIESKGKKVVGINAYCEEDGSDAGKNVRYLKVDKRAQEIQREKTSSILKSRSSAAVSGALDNLKKSAESDENLMPSIITCVKARATLEEICGTLAGIYGRYRPTRV